MSKNSNAHDQKIQSVLHVMGYDIGKYGVDGDRGEDTKLAMRRFAVAHGISMNDMSAIAQAITDKLKDPQFRQRILDGLQNAPQTRDNIIATKWILEAAGHSSVGMKDLATGMMTAKMDKPTVSALAHTQNGQVDATVVTAALGPQNQDSINLVMASKGIMPDPSKAFAGAADGQKLASVEPRLQRQPGGPAPSP